MPRLIHKNPSYRKHRASGHAIVTIDGQDIYLGPHGTQISRNEYDRIIGEWLANGRRSVVNEGASDLAIAEPICAYWKYAQGYYTSENTGEIACVKQAVKVLRRLYSRTKVSDFGPLSLKAVREKMLGQGGARTYINDQIGRLKRMFRWGVENQLVPDSVYGALDRVAGLRRGKTTARETLPIKHVADEHVDAILNHVSKQVAVMIDLQSLSGMRPVEVCLMRGCDIDTTGKLRAYQPAKHKKPSTMGMSAARSISDQRRRRSSRDSSNRTCRTIFSPADAEGVRRQERHKRRQTPLIHGNRPGSNRKRKPQRQPGDRYTVTAYRKAIIRACEIALGDAVGDSGAADEGASGSRGQVIPRRPEEAPRRA